MISQTAEYALRAVTHLAACKAAEPPTTVQIAQATQVPRNYLAKVLRSLSRAGLVHSQRGPGGGHSLRPDPKNLNVLEVIVAVDPLSRIQSCPLGIEAHQDLCPLHQRLDSARAMVESVFAETTIAELMPGKARGKGTCAFPGSTLHTRIGRELNVGSK